MTIELRKMTRELYHRLYQDWENDEAVYADMTLFRPYRYDAAQVDRYFDRKQQPDRLLFAIMLGERPIGELHLKKIDPMEKICFLSIHLQNDAVKGHGYGTEAEKQAVAYAFRALGMRTVFADAILKNTRSRHVLEKVGFRPIGQDDRFAYYRINRDTDAF